MSDAPEPFRSRRAVSDNFYPMVTGVLDSPFQPKILSVYTCYGSLVADPTVPLHSVPNRKVFVVVRGRRKKGGKLGATF